MKTVLATVILLFAITLFQNCSEQRAGSLSSSSNSTPESETQLYSNDELSSINNPKARRVERTSFDSVIDSFVVVDQDHLLSMPYPSGIDENSKGGFVYPKCDSDNLSECLVQIEHEAQTYCKNIGSKTSLFFSYTPDREIVDVSISDRVVNLSNEDPHFAVRLKSGNLVETDYKYHVCLNINKKLFKAKVQPISE